LFSKGQRGDGDDHRSKKGGKGKKNPLRGETRATCLKGSCSCSIVGGPKVRHYKAIGTQGKEGEKVNSAQRKGQGDSAVVRSRLGKGTTAVEVTLHERREKYLGGQYSISVIDVPKKGKWIHYRKGGRLSIGELDVKKRILFTRIIISMAWVLWWKSLLEPFLSRGGKVEVIEKDRWKKKRWTNHCFSGGVDTESRDLSFANGGRKKKSIWMKVIAE